MSESLARHLTLSQDPRCKIHQRTLRAAAIRAAIALEPGFISATLENNAASSSSVATTSAGPSNSTAEGATPPAPPSPIHDHPQDFFGEYDEGEMAWGEEDEREVEAAGRDPLDEDEGDSDLDEPDLNAVQDSEHTPPPDSPSQSNHGSPQNPELPLPMDEDEIRVLRRAEDGPHNPLFEERITELFGGRAAEPVNGESGVPTFTSYQEAIGESDGNPYHPYAHFVDWAVAKWAKVRGPGDTAFTDLLKIDGVSDCMLEHCGPLG